MAWTVRQYVTSAFEEIGLASYEFDLPADALTSGMKRFYSMMQEWNARGIVLGCPLPGNPDEGDLDDDTGIPDRANEAIIANLAIRLAPSFGKQVMAETKATAKFALNQLFTVAALPTPKRMPQMVAGAGNKPWIYQQPFIPETPSGLQTGPSGNLDLT